MSKTIEDLVQRLRDLRKAASYAYTNDFPGTAAWRRMADAERAVREFEAAHPEAVAELYRRFREAREALLDGKDIMGM